MKIGLIGINSLKSEDHFLLIKDAFKKNLFGIFAPHSEDIIPISKSYKLENFPSANEMFDKVNAVYFANSLELNYNFAIAALKKSCNLFIEDISGLNFEEVKQLYKVAFEGRSKIHIKHTKSFSPEYIELTDYIDQPKLIELNTNLTALRRKEYYFSEFFDNLFFADMIVNSTIKKTSTTALPIDSYHYSLIHSRVDYDNGATVNIKFNNLSSIDDSNIIIHQKNEILEINFTNHYAITHKIENGKILRTEYNIKNKNAFHNEITYFINSCNDSDSQNISESPAVLKTIQNTHLIMNHLNQISQNI